ncbi:MAG: polysaccharide deacetylase family protein [Eubacteriales bacterium]|nr:polysaccharide deacetylase family protein [Eubacteriales bacterium]
MLRLREDIPLFPGGRRKAFTLSSDDGVTQDGRLTSLLRKYGLKGTFHLNSGLMGHRDWLIQPGINASHYKYSREEISPVYDGFEIAVHTMTHPDLTRLPQAVVSCEIAENKKELEEITHQPVRGMSYPFGTYNDSVVQAAKCCGIVYSRTIHTTGSFGLPEDFLIWDPTCHYCDDRRSSLAREFLMPVSAETYCSPLLFYVWGHAYELDAYDGWESLEEFFQLIGRKEEIWYAENIEIYSYMQAVNSLIYSSSGDYITNPSCLDVWMQIDRETYCIRSGETVTVNWRHEDDSVLP